MSGKKPKHHNEKKPRNWVVRQKVIDRVGESVYIRDKKNQRAIEQERGKNWNQEDWGED